MLTFEIGTFVGRSFLSRLAESLQALASKLLLSTAFVLVPFFFAAGRLIINTAKHWQRDQVHLTGSESQDWLRGLLKRSESERRDRVRIVWGRICHSICRRFGWGRGMPLDLGAWYRVMQRHAQLYESMIEEARECAMTYNEVDCLPSVTGHFAKDLLCAMRHSRAAYGYRTSPGLLANVMAWLWSRTRSFHAFPEQMYSEVTLSIARISKEDMVAVQWNSGVYQPCFYVAIDKRHELIVVAIRGTVNYADVLTDAASMPIEVVLDEQQGFMHEGILQAAGFIMPSVQVALVEAAKRAPGWPVLVCGHSLGAGVAALLTLLLDLPQNKIHADLGPIRCIAFGCPAVACEKLSPLCQDLVTSVVVGADAVPRFGHASTDALISEAAGLSTLRRATSIVGRGVDSFVRRLHRQRTLQRQMTINPSGQMASLDFVNQPIQLYPPGRILWCVPGEHTFVAECRLDWLRDFLLHIDFINHHTPDAYLQAVLAVGKTLERAPSQAAYIQLERMQSCVSPHFTHRIRLTLGQQQGVQALALGSPRGRLKHNWKTQQVLPPRTISEESATLEDGQAGEDGQRQQRAGSRQQQQEEELAGGGQGYDEQLQVCAEKVRQESRGMEPSFRSLFTSAAPNCTGRERNGSLSPSSFGGQVMQGQCATAAAADIADAAVEERAAAVYQMNSEQAGADGSGQEEVATPPLSMQKDMLKRSVRFAD